jgi:hypothetical protein
MATGLSDEPPGTPEQKPPLSRRDFLKIAGREAADTGSKVIPGASLARAAVGKPWWQKVVSWRNQRAAEGAGTDDSAPDSSSTPLAPEPAPDIPEPESK